MVYSSKSVVDQNSNFEWVDVKVKCNYFVDASYAITKEVNPINWTSKSKDNTECNSKLSSRNRSGDSNSDLQGSSQLLCHLSNHASQKN